MILVVDIGNSHTVLGLWDKDTLMGQWRLKSERDKTPDEIAMQFHTLFAMAAFDYTAITGLAIASVVPSLEASWLECCRKHFSPSLQESTIAVNDTNLRDLITIKTEVPSEVGADRLVNGIGAWAEYQENVIVIDFGTAITFDCITADCSYLGGAILPGIAISMEALSSRAAKLPHVDISTAPRSVIGRTTIDAMKSGALYGYGGMIDGLAEILGQEMTSNNEKVHFVATGGMASLVIPYSSRVKAIDNLLTLKGLHYIYEKLKPGQ